MFGDKNKNRLHVKKEFEAEIESLKKKLDRINAADNSCLRICEQKDLEIERLKAKLPEPIPKPSSSSQSNGNTSSQPNAERILFSNYSDDISEENLATLRSIAGIKSADSTFNLNAIRFLHSDDLSNLLNKTVTGINKGRPTQPISPDKLALLKCLYNERISHLRTREKKFNRHVGHALTNINRQINKEKTKLSLDDLN